MKHHLKVSRVSPLSVVVAALGCSGAALVVPACGSSDSSKVEPTEQGGDAGAGGDADGRAASDSGGAATHESVPGGADAGTGRGGATVGGGDVGGDGVGGAGPACADSTTDGATCVDGLCTAGECLAPIALAANLNLATDPVSPGRSCAEAPAFTVASLTATGAKLSAAPLDDCLTAGDEVLLIDLQGTPDATANVGNWELLTVESLSGANVVFTGPKQRHYGSAANSDVGVGVAADAQKVALLRVPHFGELTIPSGVTLTAGAWDGSVGGVVALRAASLTVDGTITAADLGYRGGRWSRDDAGCTDSVVTESGESISGPSLSSTLRNAGGPGGLGAATGISFISNEPLNPSAGHAQPGQPGQNGNGHDLGEPGAAYGSDDGSLLTIGSGASGSLTCENNFVGPALAAGQQPAAGIVLLLTHQLTVGTTGSISATATEAQRDVSASGGTILIRGASLSLGTGRVTALGAVAHGFGGLTNQSSPGYVILETGGKVEGTTDPAANVVADPSTP
jgi:hypothetical protein